MVVSDCVKHYTYVLESPKSSECETKAYNACTGTHLLNDTYDRGRERYVDINVGRAFCVRMHQ